jgi:phosphatidylethanolamine-binding protein (PEBP) family uncharacterized protein
MENVKEIKVTSADLHDGKWDDSISNTAAGENASPELSWEAVEGAGEYAVYMIDEYDTDYWLHWRAYGVEAPGFAHGAMTPAADGGDDSAPAGKSGFPGAAFNEYVGPYPPEGVHDYVIYVFALGGPASSYPGSFDAESVSVDVVRKALDQSADCGDGNILAEGKISGTYAAV